MGCRMPGGERRADRRQGDARPRLVEGARPARQAVSAVGLVPVSDAEGKRTALRAALPGAAAARRHGTGPAHARERHAVVGQAARRVPGAAGVEGFPEALGDRGRAHRRPRRRFPVLAAHLAQHAVRLGRQCRDAADPRSRRQRRRPRRRDHQRGQGGRARHRRWRHGRDRHAREERARQGGAAPGHPARHAAADRAVRPLGDAVREGLRRAEHEQPDADVDAAHRCDRFGRRCSVRVCREGRTA